MACWPVIFLLILVLVYLSRAVLAYHRHQQQYDEQSFAEATHHVSGSPTELEEWFSGLALPFSGCWRGERGIGASGGQ